MTSDPSVIVFPTKFTKSYPKHEQTKSGGVVCSLGTMLATPFETDAHFVAYADDFECRLTSTLFSDEHSDKINAVNARMTAAVFDVDDPVTHSTDEPARPEWWTGEKVKLAQLTTAHPGLFAYRTRGGYRIVGALTTAQPMRSLADADNWKSQYLTWCRYIERRFKIVTDRVCKDWTRFYRAPHVVRGGVPQVWETIGAPAQIGVWAPELRADDMVRQKKRTQEYYGKITPVPIADPDNAYGHARIASAVHYLQSAPLSIKGQEGRVEMFRICTVLVRRMLLPIEVAADIIDAIYNPRLSDAGTATWSRDRLSTHGMSIIERLEKARDTGTTPPGNVLTEEEWTLDQEAWTLQQERFATWGIR
jgi:hypothetical protein